MSEAIVRIYKTTKWKEEFGVVRHLPVARARIIDCLPSNKKRVPGKVYLHLYAEADLDGNRYVALYTNICDEGCRPVWGPGTKTKEDRESEYHGNTNARSSGPIGGDGYYKRIRLWVERHPEEFAERFDWDPEAVGAEGSEGQSAQVDLLREEILDMAEQLKAKEVELEAKGAEIAALQAELVEKDAEIERLRRRRRADEIGRAHV